MHYCITAERRLGKLKAEGAKLRLLFCDECIFRVSDDRKIQWCMSGEDQRHAKNTNGPPLATCGAASAKDSGSLSTSTTRKGPAHVVV